VCAGRCGWAAVELRVDHPVTLSTHVPVWAKLAELLGIRIQSRLQPGQTLCSTCLQLLHTIDQLQAQLADATQHFLGRLQDPPLNSTQCDKVTVRAMSRINISVLPRQYLVPELSLMGFNIAVELRYEVLPWKHRYDICMQCGIMYDTIKHTRKCPNS
jgi:hypothetical protein